MFGSEWESSTPQMECLMRVFLIGFAAVTVCSFAMPSSSLAIDEPIIKGDELVFPEGAQIPRYETATEKLWRETHPIATERAVTPPPTGPVHCVAEFEAMEGLLFAWESFTSRQDNMIMRSPS